MAGRRASPLAVSLIASAVALLVARRTWAADAPPRLRWSDDWPRFRTSEHVAMGVIGALAVSTFFWGYPTTPSARGPILLDGPARVALRLSSSEARRTAAALSDLTFYLLLVYPVMVDAGGVAW